MVVARSEPVERAVAVRDALQQIGGQQSALGVDGLEQIAGTQSHAAPAYSLAGWKQDVGAEHVGRELRVDGDPAAGAGAFTNAACVAASAIGALAGDPAQLAALALVGRR